MSTGGRASGRVLRVDRHVPVAEVGEEDLGRPRPRPAGRSRTRPRARCTALAPAPPRRGGTAAPPAHTCTPSMAMSSGSGAVPGSAIAHRLGDPAPVRVAAVQRGLHQRRVGDRRAPRASTCSSWPPRTTTRPTRVGALAVGHDRAARAGAAARPAPRRSAARRRVSGSTRTPLAPEAMRITVSLVESWPSTETRSNERSTRPPSSRSAVSGGQRGVGLHEAEHAWRSAARSCPRPWPGPRAARGRRGARPRAPRAWRSRRWSGSRRRRRRRRRRRSSPAAAPGPRTIASASSCTPITPVEATRHRVVARPRRHRRRALHLRRGVEPAPPRGGVRVAGVGHDRAQARPGRQRSCVSSTGAASDARAGEARGARRLGASRHEQADVGLAAGLDPGARRRRRGSRAGSAGLELGARASGASTQREPKKLTLIAASALVRARASGSGSGPPARPRPSRGCRSPRRRAPCPSAGRVRRGCGRCSCRARRARRAAASASSTNGSPA